MSSHTNVAFEANSRVHVICRKFKRSLKLDEPLNNGATARESIHLEYEILDGRGCRRFRMRIAHIETIRFPYSLQQSQAMS